MNEQEKKAADKCLELVIKAENAFAASEAARAYQTMVIASRNRMENEVLSK